MKDGKEKAKTVLSMTESLFLILFLLFFFCDHPFLDIFFWGLSFVCHGLVEALGDERDERPYGAMIALSGLMESAASVVAVIPQLSAYKAQINVISLFFAILLLLSIFHRPINNLTTSVVEGVRQWFNK